MVDGSTPVPEDEPIPGGADELPAGDSRRTPSDCGRSPRGSAGRSVGPRFCWPSPKGMVARGSGPGVTPPESSGG
eukprot:8912454-Lingulodinium_polyedra.AAC.1